MVKIKNKLKYLLAVILNLTILISSNLSYAQTEINLDKNLNLGMLIIFAITFVIIILFYA